MKRIFLWTTAAVAGYLIIGIVLHYYVFPLEKPDYAFYFKPGDKFDSRWEGFDQTVLGEKDGWLHTRLEIGPRASGPPVHIHENFDESFTVREGELSVLVNGEKKTLKAGQSLRIPSGTAHRPFNETDRPVVIQSAENAKSIPTKFAYHLAQLYPFGDSLGKNPSAFKVLLQISIYGDEMDSWLADGPPLKVQKAMRFLLAPTARLLGYKNYYEEYRIKR